jgi:hypothetical protein
MHRVSMILLQCILSKLRSHNLNLTSNYKQKMGKRIFNEVIYSLHK